MIARLSSDKTLTCVQGPASQTLSLAKAGRWEQVSCYRLHVCGAQGQASREYDEQGEGMGARVAGMGGSLWKVLTWA